MEKLNCVHKRTVLLNLFLVISAFAFSINSQAQTAPDSQMLERSARSVAVVLVGDGEGVVTKIAPAVAIKADGVLLVPYHVIKDAKEVQVRLKSGEIFDDVILLGTDERRDVAAIRIQSSDLTVIETGPEVLKTGVLFFHTPGQLWATSATKLFGEKLADEVPGAGQGFKVIQFEGAINAGIDGAVLFDSTGIPAGLVTKEFTSPQRSGFAVPISSVKALSTSERKQSFNSGKALSLPVSAAAFKAAKSPSTDPKDLLLNSKTVYVYSNTTYFKEQQLINELNKRKEVKDWGWSFITGSWDARNKADLIIELDHQILSFDFTFTVRHRKSSVMITAGKAVIADGASGAPKMVDKIIKNLSAVIDPQPAKGK